MSYRSVFAWATTGVALWCTQGELTIVQGTSGVMRVAMLPGWHKLAASVLLALAAGLRSVSGVPGDSRRLAIPFCRCSRSPS